MMQEKKKIVIVGAGMAGLAAAAYLTRQNYQVLLLDKNDRCGGLLSTFESDGFFFDAGPRAFVNSGIVKPMLKDLGIEWDFLENKISIGIEDQMFRIESMDSLRDYQQVLEKLYPDKVDEVKKIISVTAMLSDYTKVLYEFDNPNFVDLMSDKKFIFRKLIPWTFKFLHALRKFNQYNLPMEVYLKRLTDSQSIMDIVTQFFFRNTPTYFALGYFYVYLDYFYPKGGTSVLPRLLQEKVEAWGGEIQLNTRVVSVNPSASSVVDAEGNSYAYDHLIWAADLKTLYRSIHAAGLDPKTVSQLNQTSERVLAAKGAESVFILFAAVNRPPSYFKEKGGEHFFYAPSRQGLGETNREQRIHLLQDFDQKSKAEVMAWLDDFCRLNTFEVSIPVLRDAALAPQGKTGIMVSCLFDYEVFEKIEQAGWYEEFKSHMEERILQLFSETLFPGLEEEVLFAFSSTPLTIQQVSGSSEGAITGWSFESEVPVINQLTEIPKSVKTCFPEIYQAGQWAYAPAGVPIAMLTGWYAAQEILKKSKKK